MLVYLCAAHMHRPTTNAECAVRQAGRRLHRSELHIFSVDVVIPSIADDDDRTLDVRYSSAAHIESVADSHDDGNPA